MRAANLPPRGQQPSAAKTILIVEDEEAVAKVLAVKFRGAGYAVVVAKNGSEALQHATADPCDLVILDLLMPRMDGFVFLHRYRGQQGNAPVVVLTNVSGADEHRRVLELGACAFLVKSEMTLDDVLRLVEERVPRPS